MDMLISLIMVIILHCTGISSHHSVHLKYIQFLFSGTPNKAGGGSKISKQTNKQAVSPPYPQMQKPKIRKQTHRNRDKRDGYRRGRGGEWVKKVRGNTGNNTAISLLGDC